MDLHVPKWIVAAFVGAAPMLGIVFIILFSCTLLGLVQRCKINLTKTYANRRRKPRQTSPESDTRHSTVTFKPISSLVIVSPFDDIPMKDIDAESSCKGYSEARDGRSKGHFRLEKLVCLHRLDSSTPTKFRRNRSLEASLAGSDYDNGSASVFTDNDYDQDRLSLLETSSQRKLSKHVASPETIIHLWHVTHANLLNLLEYCSIR